MKAYKGSRGTNSALYEGWPVNFTSGAQVRTSESNRKGAG